MLDKRVYFALLIAVFSQFINCQTCQNGGVLVTNAAASLSQVCVCQKNFIGSNCQYRIDSLSASDKAKFGCELRPCALGATCEDRPDGSYVCHCPTGSFGDLCDKTGSSDPCQARPCYNGGSCVKTSGSTFACICGSNFAGTTCKNSKVGQCAANPCQRDGLCVPVGNNDYKCQCPDWTIGKACEVVFNPCSKVSCQNSGFCLKRRTLAYECNCTSLWTGNQCEQSAATATSSQPTYTTPSVSVTYSTQSTPSTTTPATNSSCFAGSSLVETMNRGHIKVSDLKKGDLVKSYDSSSNEWIYSKFLFYLHKDDSMLAEYLSIRTEKNNNLLISSMHLIPKRTSSNGIEYVLAKYLNLNDALITENGNDKIIDISKVNEQGAYAPLLESGTISVNNILSSCYANTKWHELVHFVFKPIITYNSLFERTSVSNSNELSPNGMYWYVELLQSFLPYIPLSSSFVYV